MAAEPKGTHWRQVLRMRDIQQAAERVATEMEALDQLAMTGENFLYGVPRGGIPAALAVVAGLQRRGYRSQVVDSLKQADFIIDDIVDSGATRARVVAEHNKPFYALYEKPDAWLVFPWEGSVEGSASDIPTRLLEFIGEDVEREGLKETPRRFLDAWQEWCSGYEVKDPGSILKAFEDGAAGVDEMVLVRDIPIFSHCEHHLAPFFGTAHVAYIPSGKIVGLSKIPRLVQVFSRRLQVQERLTQQIASTIEEALKPKAVGVVLECRHMCMESRGVKTPGSSTTTSALRGAFKNDPSARAEFMRLIR
jgi:GTP cyclohydrolase I